ncbi:cupredoxin domain-containing protein [Candidatus Uhrbacteria bacterium]|nr:cupredoxin domain-containing protein [Candidatus Uhrbacteria bacterium]
MLKYLLLLPALALIGAGCAPAASVKAPLADSQPNTLDQAGEEASESAQEKVQENEQGETVVQSGNISATITPQNDEATQPTSEDGVPVTDISLGGATQKVNMEAANFSFVPKSLTAKPGEKMQITFTKNNGFHTFVIDEIGLKYAIKQGEAVTFNAPTKPGTYAFYCDVGSHRANGMEGVLIVK